MENSQKRRISQSGSLFIESLVSGGVGVGCVLVLLLLLPLVLLTLGDPNGLVFASVCFIVFVGGAACGVTAFCRYAENPPLASLIGAGMMLLPILAVSLFVGGGFDFISFALLAAIAFASSFGASFALCRINGSKRRSMKRAMKRR